MSILEFIGGYVLTGGFCAAVFAAWDGLHLHRLPGLARVGLWVALWPFWVVVCVLVVAGKREQT